jgi:KAP family P-loop domain
MAEPLAVAWSDLSTSSKSAFGWAAAAAAREQQSKDPRVGSGALLFGVLRAHPSDSEPLQLLEHYGADPKRLIDLAESMSRQRSPFSGSVRAAHRLKDYPEHSTGVRKALDVTRGLAGQDIRQGGVSLAHLFGGLLLADATASRALAEVLRGKVALEQLRRTYRDYLRAGEDITYRQFLEPVVEAEEPPPPDTPPPAPRFVRVGGPDLEGGGLVLASNVVTAAMVTGTAGSEDAIAVRFAPDADWIPAEVVARAASLALLRPSPSRLPVDDPLSMPEPGMHVTYEGVDGSEEEATIAEVGTDRIEMISLRSALPGAPIFETRTGAVVGIADGETSILSAAVLSRPPFGRTGALGTLGGAGNDSVAETDQLNFQSYVDAFASLIASPHTTPPLTIGIFGSWGMGKSFLLEHIDREIRSRQAANPDAIPRVHIVRFNAWEYSATEVVWPALVRKIVEKLDQDVPWPWWRRAWTRFKWNLPRALRQERTAIATVAVVAAVAFVVARVRGNVELARGIAALVGVVGLGGLAKAASNPVARWVTTLFTSSDYGGQIAHMDEIKNDLETLEKRLHDTNDPTKVVGRILILIDDLDRCEPEKAVEMLQAVNLLLNFKSFIVCLGIDARIVTGAIEKHYDGLLGRTGASGYEYLDKIVQIPFRIPEPNPDEVRAFIGSQLGDPKPDAGPTPTTPQDGGPDAPHDTGGAPIPETPAAGSQPETLPPDLESEAATEQDAVPFSYAELQAFETFAGLLRPNPRHLKRMVNVYRLVRTLAHSNADDALLQNPAAMIRWLVMWGQWPYASLKMLERFDELLEETPEDEVPEGLGDGDPLVYLLDEVEPRLDATTRNRLDDQAEDLRMLLKEDGAAFSWRELQRIRKYTVNFNPAVEERLRAGVERETSLAAGSAEGESVTGPG